MSQGKIHTNSGFTLVEIMIVVLIIVILSQAGNILSLFDSQKSSELEGISVNILNSIDEVKTHALLGKTEDGEIVRKRKIDLNSQGDTLSYMTSVNFAENAEDTFIDDTVRTIGLNGNSWSLATCPGTTPNPNEGNINTDVTGLIVQFQGENIEFTKIDENGVTTTITEPHVIIMIGDDTRKREIHIDRRTGLTYERGTNAPLITPPSCQ